MGFNQTDYLLYAYPIIATLCFISFTIYTVINTKPSDNVNVINKTIGYYLMFTAIILSWSAAIHVRMSIPIYILGLFCVVASTTGGPNITKYFVILGFIIQMIMIGSGSILSGTGMFVAISSTKCDEYFAGSDISRCKNDGFLMAAQFFATVAMFILPVALLSSLPSVVDVTSDSSKPNNSPLLEDC